LREISSPEAISNPYHPSNNTGVGLTIAIGLIVTREGAAGAILEEFWPDIHDRLVHRRHKQEAAVNCSLFY
jgi:hypothetical protein